MKNTGLAHRLWRGLRDNLSFLAVILSTFVALTLIVALTFGTFYQSARENAITIGRMTVEQESRRIEDSLYSGMNTLLVSSCTVDAMLTRGATTEEIAAYMVEQTQGIIHGINPDFSGIYGVINDVYVDGVGWEPEEGYDPYTRPWYIAAAEKGGALAIVSPYIDAQTGMIMVSFSRLLSDGKSAVSFDAALDNIYAVTETIQLKGKGYCFLIDKDGLVIAHRDEGEVGKNYLTDPEFEGSRLKELISGIRADGAAQALQHVSLDGGDCMVFTDTVQNEWNVVLVVNSADLFAEIKGSLISSILVSLAIFILVGYFCTSNYTNRKRAIRYAQHIRTDDLTGLNNRGEFDRYAKTLTTNVTPYRRLYLLLFDADGFKGINDRFGHQEGDRALRYIAKALMAVCHGTDWFCARYGGDEFVMLCRLEDGGEVERICAAINERLRETTRENTLPYTLSLSYGSACYKPESQTFTDLVDEADQQLYRMKDEKRSRAL